MADDAAPRLHAATPPDADGGDRPGTPAATGDSAPPSARRATNDRAEAPSGAGGARPAAGGTGGDDPRPGDDPRNGAGARDGEAGNTSAARRRPPGKRPSRRTLTLIAIPIIGLIIASNVGDAMAPTLVDTHPAWLTALNPRTRNLVLVTNSMDAWAFYGIATLRLVASDPLFFLLGHWYGDTAITWMERRTRTWGSTLRAAEGWFSKAAYPIVFIAPNQWICLFAGAAGMSVAGFLALNLAGTVTRLYLIRRFGEAFEGPLDDVVDWIGDNRLPLLALTIAITVGSILLEARKGETEVTSIAHLDEELEAAAAETPGDDEPGNDTRHDEGPRNEGPRNEGPRDD